MLLNLAGLLLAACATPVPGDSRDAPADESLAPRLTITPAELGFGDVPVGVPSTLELRIANEGGGDLLATLALSDAAAGFFVDTLDVELEADVGQRVNVTFTPFAVGEVAISLVVTSNDEVEPVKFVPITGSGLGPQLEAAADPFDLGDVALRCPAKGPIVVRNVGTTPVTIDAFTFADPMFTTLSPGGTLAPDEGVSVNVTATPLMLGESIGTLVAETALGSVYAGTVLVTGIEREVIQETYTVPTDDSDVLVVLDGTLPDGIEGIRGQLEALLVLAAGDHRLAVSVADDGCVPGGWIDNATVDARAALDQMLAAEVGVLADEGFGRGLAALSAEALRAGGCNEGFLRDDPALLVVGVSDQHESSAVGFDEFVSTLEGLEATAGRATIHAVGGDWPVGCGEATAAAGWYEAALSTDGLYLSFCDEGWGQDIVDAVAAGIGAGTTIELSDYPDAARLHVFVDGVEVTTGWSYQTVNNAIEFDAELPEGTTVEVVYELSYCP